MTVASKRSRVIARLLQGPATSFDLESDAHDHCPNSTVSELRREGVEIRSERVAVPGYGGTLAYIARYTLADGSRDLARQLMARRSCNRGAA